MWTIFRGGRIHIWCFCICGRIKSFSIVSVNAALSEDKWTQWESSEQIFLSEDPSAAQRLHSISFLFTACILKYHLDAQCVHNRKVKTGCWGGGRPDCEARWTLPPSSTRTDRYLIPPFFFFFFSKSVFLQFSGSFSPPEILQQVKSLFYFILLRSPNKLTQSESAQNAVKLEMNSSSNLLKELLPDWANAAEL